MPQKESKISNPKEKLMFENTGKYRGGTRPRKRMTLEQQAEPLIYTLAKPSLS
jgi:hypothetical protein